ncbi:MAG: hypothetical protein ACRDLT_05175 [Solirubrobacteraceae bacterium]
MLLHAAGERPRTVEVTYRVWRHQPRLSAAFLAHHEEQKRRGAGGSLITLRGTDDGEPEPDEREETVRIWRDDLMARVEHHGGDRDGCYAVAVPPLWWMWDERIGAQSNQDDPTVGSNVGQEMELMLDPTPLLSSLRFRVVGDSEVAGRATVTAHGTPRHLTDDSGRSFELHHLGTGAEYYELEVDKQRGVLLAATAVRDDEPFHRITTLAIRFDEPIAREMFRFEPPAGEEIQPTRAGSRARHVTLVEAQQQASFTVLMPDTVPENWQVHCRLIEASERPESSEQIALHYNSTDGHESISITQMPAGASNPYKSIGNEEDWEDVTRNDRTIRTRPASWGQAQAQLELHGTFVYLQSDNLTRGQLVSIAAGLRPVPTTSSI